MTSSLTGNDSWPRRWRGSVAVMMRCDDALASPVWRPVRHRGTRQMSLVWSSECLNHIDIK